MNFDAAALIGLSQQARSAATAAERRFVLLNRTRDVLPYHAAVLWQPGGGVLGHSGVSQVDAQGPYGQWLKRLCQQLEARPVGRVQARDVDAALAAEWPQWWPPHLLWLPGPTTGDAACLLAREVPWAEPEQALLTEWFALWSLTERASSATPRRAWSPGRGGARAWRSRGLWGAGALVLLALLPLHPTLRAPGELVPREPTVLRVAMDGTVRRLLVEPNQAVQPGQPLAELDDAASASRLQAARQALAAAEAEWRQTSQQALADARAKTQLPAVQAKLEQQQTEVQYLEQQAQRTVLLAPHAGVVLVDDPGSWAGRTVQAGETVLRVAQPADQELEAWLPAADAIDLPAGSTMHLHLASRPAEPVPAALRLYAYEAERRPDGTLAYRLRGQLRGAATERLGARGTVRIEAPRVPLAYAMLRRPLAAWREWTGW